MLNPNPRQELEFNIVIKSVLEIENGGIKKPWFIFGESITAQPQGRENNFMGGFSSSAVQGVGRGNRYKNLDK